MCKNNNIDYSCYIILSNGRKLYTAIFNGHQEIPNIRADEELKKYITSSNISQSENDSDCSSEPSQVYNYVISRVFNKYQLKLSQVFFIYPDNKREPKSECLYFYGTMLPDAYNKLEWSINGITFAKLEKNGCKVPKECIEKIKEYDKTYKSKTRYFQTVIAPRIQPILTVIINIILTICIAYTSNALIKEQNRIGKTEYEPVLFVQLAHMKSDSYENPYISISNYGYMITEYRGTARCIIKVKSDGEEKYYFLFEAFNRIIYPYEYENDHLIMEITQMDKSLDIIHKVERLKSIKGVEDVEEMDYVRIEYKNALGEKTIRYYDVSNGFLELSRENGYLIFEKGYVYEDNAIKTIAMEPIESIDELLEIYQ